MRNHGENYIQLAKLCVGDDTVYWTGQQLFLLGGTESL